MNTIDGNKVIAEFMGGIFYPDTNLFVFTKNCQTDKAKRYKPETLKYHLSWDWLMPVVMKIETMGFDVNIKGIVCSVNRLLETETFIQLCLGEKSRKIELVYSVVIAFIEWYNINK